MNIFKPSLLTKFNMRKGRRGICFIQKDKMKNTRFTKTLKDKKVELFEIKVSVI